MASDFGVWAMREAGRNEYTVGRNEYEKRGAFIVTQYLLRCGAHLSQCGISRDAARHVATKADAPYTAPITLRALESKSPSRPHGN